MCPHLLSADWSYAVQCMCKQTLSVSGSMAQSALVSPVVHLAMSTLLAAPSSPNLTQTWWMLQALTELALDYENDKANVPVPIMYDDETAYLCDQGSA